MLTPLSVAAYCESHGPECTVVAIYNEGSDYTWWGAYCGGGWEGSGRIGGNEEEAHCEGDFLDPRGCYL